MKNDDQMQKNKTKEAIFEEMIRYAANQEVERFDDDFPSEEELQKLIRPSERFEKNMRKIINQAKREMRLKAILKVTTKIAASIIIFIAVFLTIALSVEATRIEIINFITEAKREYINIRFEDQSNRSIKENEFFKDWDRIYLPQYVPDGFEIVKAERLIKIHMIEYTNKEGEMVTLSYSPVSSSTLSVDSEEAIIKETTIFGNKAMVIKKNSNGTQKNKVVFHNSEMAFYISSSYDAEELLKMAASVKLTK